MFERAAVVCEYQVRHTCWNQSLQPRCGSHRGCWCSCRTLLSVDSSHWSQPPPPSSLTQDFVNFHLTRRWCASVNNASIRWHYSTQRPGGWPTSMLQKL